MENIFKDTSFGKQKACKNTRMMLYFYYFVGW